MDLDQVDLMNKVNRLEKDLLQKEKEYKMLSMRIRDSDQGTLRVRRRSLINIARNANGGSPMRLVKSASKYRS